jgi:zeaxanthin glucosyltransferase
MVPFRGLTTAGVRTAIEEVLSNAVYAANARRLQQSIADAGGVVRAADIVEQVVH